MADCPRDERGGEVQKERGDDGEREGLLMGRCGQPAGHGSQYGRLEDAVHEHLIRYLSSNTSKGEQACEER